jgi:hypothetical protein
MRLPIGALAARFDIVLSNTPAAVPVLVMTNTSEPERNPDFRVGDSWRSDVRHASPQSQVYLHLWKDGADLGISGPYGTTDNSGAWTLTGSYGAADIGSWQVQAIIGNAASLETSAPVTIDIRSS